MANSRSKRSAHRTNNQPSINSALPDRVRGLILLAVAVSGLSLPAGAQEIDRATLQAEAAAGDTDAQTTLGEALVYGLGGLKIDAAAGRAYLETAVTRGDTGAQTILGKLLLDGVYLDPDPARGVALLQSAAEAGDTEAQTTLGLALLWGTDVAANPKQARDWLESAARAGNTRAMRSLGEALIGGWALERDSATGRALLEEAAGQGDVDSKLTLGSFLMAGRDLPRDMPRATALFEEAAAAGSAEGLEKLGAFLMWTERDPAAAESYLRRAGEMGLSSAWVTLAEGAMYGYLGLTERDRFNEFADLARAAGAERIEVLAADRQMWGIGMRASGPKTISLLEQAAENGNTAALKRLIGLVRDGNNLNIRKDPDKARAFVERFPDLLSPAETARYTFSIDAAKARDVPGYKAVTANMADEPDYAGEEFARDLYAANPNVAIYLLQRDLKARGLYTGALDGMAGPKTIRALSRACRQLTDTRHCRNSVLHPDVIGALLARASGS